MINETTEKKLDSMFSALVPGAGKAETLGGEILRAVNRIGYRFFNDGDKVWQGYGRETVNPAMRFLHHILHHGVPATDEFLKQVDALYNRQPHSDNDEQYEALIDALVISCMDSIEKFNLGAEKNFVGDMWDYADPDEDVDEGEDEDEEYEFYGYDDDCDEEEEYAEDEE